MSTRPTVVILGAGIAGLQCALTLADRLGRKQARIVLIDKQSQHFIHSSLNRVVAGTSLIEPVAASISSIVAGKSIEFLHDLVTGIDTTTQRVSLGTTDQLAYDYLVIALGTTTDDSGLPGVRDHALSLQNMHDAMRLRKLLQQHGRRRQPKRLVVVGGGLAGVELVCTLISLKELQIDLIEKDGHLLSGQPRSVSDRISSWLTSRGVDVYTDEAVAKVSASKISLISKRTLDYDLLIWTGGVKANPLVARSGLEVDDNGRAIVAPTLQARGFRRVMVIGDAAHFSYYGRALPVMHWQAVSQGKLAANNVARLLRDRPPSRYYPKAVPTIINLGRQTSYLTYGPVVLSGHWVVRLRDWLESWYVSGLMSLKVISDKK